MNGRQPIFVFCAVTAFVLAVVGGPSSARRFYLFLVIMILAFAGTGCSPEFNKADADKEVYKIIDQKWKPAFGQKANYIVADSNITSANDVNADKTSITPTHLTLSQAVALATKYNRNYQSAKEDLYLRALTLTAERYKYSLQWFATVDVKYTKSGEDIEDKTADAEFGVRNTFLTPDGIIANSSLVIDWARFLTGDPRTTLSSVLRGDVAIPLLGRGKGKVAWEELTQTERSVLYQIRSFNRFRQSFVVDTINAYYGVLKQRDGVTNSKNNWERSVDFRKQAELEAKTGRTPQFEVDQARQRELAAYDGFVSATQSYEQTLDSFKVRLTLPTRAEIELDQNELKALQDMGITEPKYTVDDAIDTALLTRLDLANAADDVEDSSRKVALAAEGLGVQLNLTGTANVNSEEKTNFDNLQFHKGNYTAILSADLPFDRKNQRNAYRTALINLEQSQRDYENNIDQVTLDVRQAYRQLLATAEQYNTQRKSLSLAEERVKNMPLLLKSGRAVIRDMLDAQDALLSAQNALTSALINHLNAKLSFYRDVGILQVKPDGMWAQTDTVSGKSTNGREQDKQSTDKNI